MASLKKCVLNWSVLDGLKGLEAHIVIKGKDILE
jgi:hypothetical protein